MFEHLEVIVLRKRLPQLRHTKMPAGALERESRMFAKQGTKKGSKTRPTASRPHYMKVNQIGARVSKSSCVISNDV